MRLKSLSQLIAQMTVILFLTNPEMIRAATPQHLRGHLPPNPASYKAVGSLPSGQILKLAISLPFRDPEGLEEFLQRLNDPRSKLHHRYLTPSEFAARFSPSEQDYQEAMRFARAAGFRVTLTHPNRLLFGVEAAARDVERAMNLRLRTYSDPVTGRIFHSPDLEPSLNTEVKLLHVSGLDDRIEPKHWSRPSAMAAPRRGSGTGGTFLGSDFRNAYVPGTTLTGAGQTLGLFELNGYYPADIAAYKNLAGLPNVPLENVLIDGFTGSPGGRRSAGLNEEVALDIEVAISMAPGLSKVIVYEASPGASTATLNHVLNRMVTDNQARQISCSWGFDLDISSIQIFKQMAAQGQSFFLASGDSGAFSGPVVQPADYPYVTVVGGTVLTTGEDGSWLKEVAWSDGGGGISTLFPIPDWQRGLDMTKNKGSLVMRNVPDVAMVAENILVIANNGRTITLGGTSVSAPLWAAFTALINEQAALQGKPPVGFLNPALYSVGRSTTSSNAFHDIVEGSNVNSMSPDAFHAVPGYDLCTGWGTPNGTNFINAILALTPESPLQVAPPFGFTASGPAGGKPNVSTQTYILTNTGTGRISWIATNSSPWLTIMPSEGSLDPGDSSNTVTVSLNDQASALLVGAYSDTVVFADLTHGTTLKREHELIVGNGGFESGNLSSWSLTGSTGSNFADSYDFADFAGFTTIPGVDDSAFVHTGVYGAFLGEPFKLGKLSQTMSTVPLQNYLISFWLTNPMPGTPNHFIATFGGKVLFDERDLGDFPWTFHQFVATAAIDRTLLQFSFQNDDNAFGLDDVSVRLLQGPVFKSATTSASGFTLRWEAAPGFQYQIQATSSLNVPSWSNLGDRVTPDSSGGFSFTDPESNIPARFYRLVLLP